MNKDNHYTDIEPADDDGLKLKARRMKMYSPEALRRALVVDRIIVSHTAFKDALESLDRSFQLTKEFSVPAGLKVFGPSGCGKSEVTNYFRNSLPRFDLVEAGMGVITVDTPKLPQVSSVITAVLTALEYPFSSVTKETVDIKRGLSVKALQRKGTRIVVMDEAHNLFTSNSSRFTGDGTPVTVYLRHIADFAKVAICLTGGPALERLGSFDKYLAARCETPVKLIDFPFGGEWLGIVKAFIRQCDSFNLGFVDEPEQQRLFFQGAAGNLRRLKWLLVEAVMVGVDAKQEQLDKGCMAIAYQRLYGAASNPWGK